MASKVISHTFVCVKIVVVLRCLIGSLLYDEREEGRVCTKIRRNDAAFIWSFRLAARS